MRKYLIICLVFIFQIDAKPLSLNHIPYGDQEKLEAFFHYLITSSMIGYTLCGEKPVAIETFPKLSQISPQLAIKVFSNCPGYSILWSGLEIWEKYASQFSSSKFIFKFIPKYHTLMIINKQQAKKVIEENLDLFHKYYSREPSDNILDEICTQDNEKIFKNRILLGILLGYGRNNAIAYSNGSFFQKLEGIELYDGNLSLQSVLNPGFFIIKNGTNEEENSRVIRRFKNAKKNIYFSFATGGYLENFLKLFLNEVDIH